MKYRGIIFDLDGTLLDTVEDIADSMNQVLMAEGRRTFSYDDYRQKIGGGFRSLVINCLDKGAEDQDIDRLEGELRRVYETRYRKKTRPYEGIEELLDLLQDRKVSLAINTNKREAYAQVLVEEIFPQIDFVRLTGQEESRALKPDPAGAWEVLKAMGLDASEVLYIGDSKVDVKTGHNGGFKVVGVDWGFRGQEELRASGADYIVLEPLEILDIVETS